MLAKVIREVRVDSDDDMLDFLTNENMVKRFYLSMVLFLKAYHGGLLTYPVHVLLWDDRTVTYGDAPLSIDEVKADNFKQQSFIDFINDKTWN